MSERKRLIFTAVAIGLVGIVTGLFLAGGLLPLQGAGLQQYDEKTMTSIKTTRTVHGQADFGQHEHITTTETTVTETTPHGYFHDFAEKLAPGMFQTESTPKQGPNEVWIWGREFTPNVLTVPVGTKVTWINKSSEQHTVTGDNSLFNSIIYIRGSIADSFSYTFTEPGTYTYHCQPHSGMTGKIIVTAAP